MVKILKENLKEFFFFYENRLCNKLFFWVKRQIIVRDKVGFNRMIFFKR